MSMATATRSSTDGEVIAVGQWKPISCGEPTFVQSSVVDNREFVCFLELLRPSVTRAT